LPKIRGNFYEDLIIIIIIIIIIIVIIIIIIIIIIINKKYQDLAREVRKMWGQQLRSTLG